MASDVQICNAALRRLGDERITSFADNSKRAKLCDDCYEDVRDRVLVSHPWNFAKKRVALAKLTTTPLFGYDSEFQLPSDCLRVVEVEETEPGSIDYEIEGTTLLCDEDSINIGYIAKITNTALFSPHFQRVLELELAKELAYTLVQSNTLKAAIDKELDDAKRNARLFDAQEGTPRQFYRSDWTNER